jgi:Lipase (class 3)
MEGLVLKILYRPSWKGAKMIKVISWLVVFLTSVFYSRFAVFAEQAVKLNVELANAYAIHAMMSSNAYVGNEDRIYFPLEELGWRKIDLSGKPIARDKNSYEPRTIWGKIFSNLQFDIWVHQASSETIVAFKGTEGIMDWLAANLSIGVSIPYKSAKKQLRGLIENKQHRRLSLTGHSLGGGVALSVSVWEGIDAIVFNTSPRIFDGSENKNEPAIRKAIFQEGDILENIRKFHPKFKQKVQANDIIQTSFDYGGRNEHRADLLAEGILRCANAEQLVAMAKKLPVKVRCHF